MAKLILVEGIAGSGKSTTAKKIEQVLRDWFDQVIDYFEGSNYGKTEEVTGRAGVLKFFRRRHRARARHHRPAAH